MATRSTDAVRNEAGRRASRTKPAGRPGRDRAGLLASVLGDRHVPGTGSSRWRYFFSGIWLAYLIQPVSDLFSHGGAAVDRRRHHHHDRLLRHLPARSCSCASRGRGWPSTGSAPSPRWPRWPAWCTARTGRRCGSTYPPRPASCSTSAFGSRRASLGVFAITGCYLLFCWITHLDLGTTLAVLLPVLLIGLAMMGFRTQISLMHELDQARGTVAKLAVNEERLRLARDMHDLTGQSLSMITLKSELAAKRLAKLPSSAERDAVLTELGDIGRVSRQTLHDIREAVSGYRRPTLAIEVITARNALEAAGIALDDDAELTLRSGTFDPAAEAVLAWCLREAVTNVIRHSRARHCRIRLTERAGELSLEITDDGHGFASQDPGRGRPETPTAPRAAACAACPNACPPSAAACPSARLRRSGPTGVAAASASPRPCPPCPSPAPPRAAPRIIASYDPGRSPSGCCSPKTR